MSGKTVRYIGLSIKMSQLRCLYFAAQCSLISNSSNFPSHYHCLTDNRLSSVSFSQDKIAKVIQNLDPNMLKICGPAICKPLEIIFNQLTEISVFPSEWKESNIASVNKKEYKQILQKYRLVSLLPICGKILNV